MNRPPPARPPGQNTATCDVPSRIHSRTTPSTAWTATPGYREVTIAIDGVETHWETIFDTSTVVFLGTDEDLRWFTLMRPLPD